MESRPKRRRTGGTARLSRQSALLLLRDILRWDELERSWRTVRVRCAGRVWRKHRIDFADAFKELLPIKGRKEPHAGDDVANRRLCSCLSLMFGVYNLLGRQPFQNEPLLKPLQRGPYLRILIAKTLCKLNDKRAVEFLVLAGCRLQHTDQLARLAGGGVQKTVAQRGALVPFATRKDSRGQPPQVFDKRDSQGDRDSPQLSNGQRGDLLVGAHEARERAGVETTVGVRNQSQGNRVHARITLEFAPLKLR